VNHRHGSVPFLATQWRAVIGADLCEITSVWPKKRMVHQ